MIIIKILVISDSHGSVFYLKEILVRELTANIVIHLGDGANEMLDMFDYTEGKTVYTLKGNCDSAAYGFPEKLSFICEDKRLSACHGHQYSVKYGLQKLLYAGAEDGCDVCFFGHTHRQCCEYADGIYLFNPGAVINGEYGTAEIKNDRIFLQLRHI